MRSRTHSALILYLLGLVLGLLCLWPAAQPAQATTPLASPLPTPLAVGLLTIALKVFLGGAYNATTQLMNDTLRTQNLLPTTEPYSALARFVHSGNESVNAGVFAVTGNHAIVDWVLVELRAASDPTHILATRAALVQRDGDIVDMDGVSPVTFANQPSGNYYVVVGHDNHLRVMTASPVALSATATLLDFTNPATPTYGTAAQMIVGTRRAVWGGDANQDNRVINNGANTDASAVIGRVLTAPGNPQGNNNYSVPGYALTDLNLDGKTIANGPGNDLSVLSTTVLGHPSNPTGNNNYIVKEQVPVGVRFTPALPTAVLPASVPNVATYLLRNSDYTTSLNPALKAAWLQRGEPVPATRTALPALASGTSQTPTVLAAAGQAPHQATEQTGWVTLYSENFDAGFPSVGQHGNCQLELRSNRASDYVWGGNNAHTDAASAGAAWPAAAGNLGKLLRPGSDTYPENTTTQMLCRFTNLNVANLKNIRVEFALWLDAADANDLFFVGFNTGGTTYYGQTWQNTPVDSNRNPTWQRYSFFYPELATQVQANNGNLAIMWEFRSDGTRHATARGPWLDSIIVERYVEPDTSLNCQAYVTDPTTQITVPGAPGTGKVSKGIVLPPDTQDDTWATGLDPALITRLQSAKTNWVRLEFMIQPSAYLHLRDATSVPNSIDLKHYDQLIDMLCASHMPVLGLVDYQTIADQSWKGASGDGSISDSYLNTFTKTVSTLAAYYNHRIKVWEVWNEPDAIESKLSPAAYAKLLVGVSPVIRNQGAQVVFGGLVSADDTSRSYLSAFYTALKNNHQGITTPFDIFGIHPYPSKQYTDANGKRLLDPNLYLRKESPTIFDKFHIVLKGTNDLNRNDSNKDIWVTEIGWNSAVGSDAEKQHVCSAAEELWVTPNQQENYLATSLNILFRETAWPGENRASVTKAFWYQYRDTGSDLNKLTQCVNWPDQGSVSWYVTYLYTLLFGPAATEKVTVPWSYGLYDGNLQPKTGVFCAFKEYPYWPENCYAFLYRVYLPNIRRPAATTGK